jgi:hypothetical protein
MDFRYGLAMADNNVDDEWRRAAEGLPSSEEEEEEEEEEDDEEVTATAVNTIIQKTEPGDNPNSTKFSIKFENFEELPSDIDHAVTSSTFSCFGHQWCAIIYPGGEGGSAELVSVYLQRVSAGEDLMSIQFSIGINHVTSHFVHDFAHLDAWGEYSLRMRSLIIDNCLVKGGLTIYVNMELGEFIPKNPLTAKKRCSSCLESKTTPMSYLRSVSNRTLTELRMMHPSHLIVFLHTDFFCSIILLNLLLSAKHQKE